MGFSIAIDGPAGAGKSTIAKKIAEKLGFIYVDTGAMYRAIALYLLRNHIDAEDSDKISQACKNADITIRYKDGEQQVILNQENVSTLIRTEEVGTMASAGAKNKDVRLKLVELQRKLAEQADVIMDGRDIGTHVLPGADIKIFLTADSGVRAARRWKELKEKGSTDSLDKIEKDIIARDEQDMNREFAPLCQAEDAILLDTSHMEIEAVTEEIIRLYHEKSRR